MRGARPRLPTAFREGRWAAEVVKVGPNVKEEIALLGPYAKVRVVPVGLDSRASIGVCSLQIDDECQALGLAQTSTDTHATR